MAHHSLLTTHYAPLTIHFAHCSSPVRKLAGLLLVISGGPAVFSTCERANMALVLTSGPALEPVTVAEAKAHARIDQSAEDTLIASLILTSRLHIEAALGLALITQSWTYTLDAWPDRPDLALPIRPVQSIAGVRVLAADGTPTVVIPSSYALDGKAGPPRLLRTTDAWPKPGRATAGIEINFTAGYGSTASDVPAAIKHALLMLVAHWHEHREPAELGLHADTIPRGVSTLLSPYAVPRL
jgi:uncharacterized phiE125 gp8 family phage protein